jgi:type I restriction enzyme S subunit
MYNKFLNKMFESFPTNWKLMPLKKVAIVRPSNVDKKSNEKEKQIYLCNYTDVYYNNFITDELSFMQATATENEIKKFSLMSGDVIITKDSEDRYDIGVPSLVLKDLPNVLCGYHLALIRTKSQILLGSYLCSLLKTHNMRHYLSIISNGVTRFGLTSDALSNMILPIPPLKEQLAISKIMMLLDKYIEYVNKLLAAKITLKRGIIQQLLTGKNRFKGFTRKWENQELRNFLKPIQRPVPKPDKKYIALGIRSHGKGTFLRNVENPDEVMMETLYEVAQGNLIVNITFAWEGAIALAKRTDNGALVSHRFPTFVFKEDIVIPDYFKQVMLTKRFVHELGLVSPGGAGRNRVMSKKGFLKIKIPSPEIKEQRKIAELLCSLDKEIELVERQLDALQTQKRGLMQKLLTGKIRVKV